MANFTAWKQGHFYGSAKLTKSQYFVLDAIVVTAAVVFVVTLGLYSIILIVVGMAYCCWKWRKNKRLVGRGKSGE